MHTAPSNSKNNGFLVGLLLLPALMVGVAYAAVPLYQLFCQVTGYGGTTQIADQNNTAIPVLDREIKVFFTSSTHRDMPWEFKPVQASQTLKIGEQGLAFYEAYNPTDQVIKGTASFNVTPHKAGSYFMKIDCFCFTEQILQPGERVQMPVTYYIDPEIVEDDGLNDVTDMSLSYTFFLLEDEK